MGKYDRTAISDKLYDIKEGNYEHLGIPKYTLTEIENITGVPKQQINSYINGTIPRLDTVVKLSEGLEVSVDFLAYDDVKYPSVDTQTIYDEIGFSADTITLLKALRHNKKLDLTLIMDTLELLIKYAGNRYNDPLTAIGKFLKIQEEENDDIYLVDGKKLNEFEDVLASSDSVEDIKAEYEKFIYGSPQTLQSSGIATAIQKVNKDLLLLQNVENQLSSLKGTLWSDLEEFNANKIDNVEDVIPVDWLNNTIL